MKTWIIVVSIIAVLAMASVFVVNALGDNTNTVESKTTNSCSASSCTGSCQASCNAGSTCGCGNCAAKTGGSCGCGAS